MPLILTSALVDVDSRPIAFEAHYFDGLTSTAHRVAVRLEPGHLVLRGDGIERRVPVAELTLAPSVGSAQAVVMLGGDAELHVADLPAFDALAKAVRPASVEHFTRFLEARFRYALAALAFSVLFVVVGLRYGLPALAKTIAGELPAGFEQMVGEQSLKAADKLLLEPSKLPGARQKEISSRLQSACAKIQCPTYQLLFRGGEIGPNAFALPGGIVVVTDDLVEIAKNDQEILAVLFHELGHVRYQHGIRLVIQSTGAAALLVVVTGDLSQFSDMASGLPSLLMQSGYQRDMESEADNYALHTLLETAIPPKHFADILQRITEKYGMEDSNGVASLLDSHPGTQLRIQAFLAASDDAKPDIPPQ